MKDTDTHRWIAAFTEKGPPIWLTDEVKLPEQLRRLRWLTQAPPNTPAWQTGWRYYHEGKSLEDKPQTEDPGGWTKERVEPIATHIRKG